MAKAITLMNTDKQVKRDRYERMDEHLGAILRYAARDASQSPTYTSIGAAIGRVNRERRQLAQEQSSRQKFHLY